MKFLEKLFEGILWRSRYVVLLAVVASMAAAIGVIYITTVDVVYLMSHLLHYADASVTADARQILHNETITHVVEAVDGYLIATFYADFFIGVV